MDGLTPLSERVTKALAQVEAAPDADGRFRAMVEAAQELSGCPRVALRLRHGGTGWMPFVASLGMGDRFLRDETVLAESECMCGRVVRGDVDPKLGFFTDRGSFHHGRLQHILDAYTSEDIGDVRGRCIGLGYETVALVPVKVDGQPVGMLYLSSDDEEAIDEEALADLESLCEAAGPALMRHSAEDRERATSKLLRGTLTPRPGTHVGGLEVGTSQLAAGPDKVLGGDFCEAIEVGGGRALLFVGDVAGEGIEVAGLAAHCRWTLSGLACEGAEVDDVADLLSRANDILSSELPDDRFATVVVASFDPETRRLEIALAGHPQPLVADPSGERSPVGSTSPPLAVSSESCYEPEVTTLPEGCTLVMYTDGLLDAPGPDDRFGESRLADAVGSALVLPIQELAESICRAASEFAGGRHKDDMLTLAAREE